MWMSGIHHQGTNTIPDENVCYFTLSRRQVFVSVEILENYIFTATSSKLTVRIFIPVSRNCHSETSNAPNNKEEKICDSWRTEEWSSENQCSFYTSHYLTLQVTAQTRRADEGLMGCKWINQLDEVKSHTTWLWSSNYLNSTSLWAVL